MRCLLLAFAVAMAVPTLGAGQVRTKPPETFSARAEAEVTAGAAATTLTIHIDRYTTDSERHAAVSVLETGGAAALTVILRKTPSTGYVEFDAKRWAIRYARQEATPIGRQLVVVLDQPLCVVADAERDALRRAGFDLAVIQFEVDETGTGEGTMATAARIRAGGAAGVELADASGNPVRLTVTKVAS